MIVVLKYQRNVPRRMGGGLAGGAHARATDGVVNRCRPSRWSWGCPSTRARGELGKLPSASRTALVEEVAQPNDAICYRLLGDTAAVAAFLDRLLHHAHVVTCGSRSWRTRRQGEWTAS